MGNVEVVIKIPQKVYKAICDKNALGCDISDIKNIICNGVSLPEGHGNLIDADALVKKMEEREEKMKDDRSMWETACVETAIDMFAPTVIEKDYGSLEEKYLGSFDNKTGIYADINTPETVSMADTNDIEI